MKEKIPLNKLELRVLEISHKKKLSHLSSCLTTVGLIDKIYKVMEDNDVFVLSNGHAGLALYVVLEKYKGHNAEELFDKHGVHPNRDPDHDIHVSTGSLGQGLPIAVGMAIADRKRNVYCMVSDGECAEGSVWEALRIASELRLENLRVEVVANGFSAYSKIDPEWLDMRLNNFFPTLVMRPNMYKYPGYLQGYKGHYHILSDEEYKEIVK